MTQLDTDLLPTYLFRSITSINAAYFSITLCLLLELVEETDALYAYLFVSVAQCIIFTIIDCWKSINTFTPSTMTFIWMSSSTIVITWFIVYLVIGNVQKSAIILAVIPTLCSLNVILKVCSSS